MLQEGIPVAVGSGGSEVFQLLLAENDATSELAERIVGVSVGAALEVAVNTVNELERLVANLTVELGAPGRLLGVCSPLVICVRVLPELVWLLCANALTLVSGETELGPDTGMEDAMVGAKDCSPLN